VRLSIHGRGATWNRELLVEVRLVECGRASIVQKHHYLEKDTAREVAHLYLMWKDEYVHQTLFCHNDQQQQGMDTSLKRFKGFERLEVIGL